MFKIGLFAVSFGLQDDVILVELVSQQFQKLDKSDELMTHLNETTVDWRRSGLETSHLESVVLYDLTYKLWVVSIACHQGTGPFFTELITLCNTRYNITRQDMTRVWQFLIFVILLS